MASRRAWRSEARSVPVGFAGLRPGRDGMQSSLATKADKTEVRKSAPIPPSPSPRPVGGSGVDVRGEHWRSYQTREVRQESLDTTGSQRGHGRRLRPPGRIAHNTAIGYASIIRDRRSLVVRRNHTRTDNGDDRKHSGCACHSGGRFRAVRVLIDETMVGYLSADAVLRAQPVVENWRPVISSLLRQRFSSAGRTARFWAMDWDNVWASNSGSAGCSDSVGRGGPKPTMCRRWTWTHSKAAMAV